MTRVKIFDTVRVTVRMQPRLPQQAMLFICNYCLRPPEEIIGDDSPKCLKCRRPMVRATLSYKGIWMSPNFVISRMLKIIATYGYRLAESCRCFKQEREAWTTALWALGLIESHGREYWVEIETEEATPDTKVHALDQSTGNNQIGTYDIEVVDWEEHVDDLMEIIKKKCGRAYPSYFGLLILGRNGKTIYPDAVIEAISQIKRVTFAEIWMVGRALEDNGRVQMVRFYPHRGDIHFDIRDAMRRNEGQKDFMQPQGRGTGLEIHSLGDMYLPIPRCPHSS
jgi:hypothetical protein